MAKLKINNFGSSILHLKRQPCVGVSPASWTTVSYSKP